MEDVRVRADIEIKNKRKHTDLTGFGASPMSIGQHQLISLSRGREML